MLVSGRGGLPRLRSLYDTFGDRPRLFLAYLRHYVAPGTERMVGPLYYSDRLLAPGARVAPTPAAEYEKDHEHDH
jgi:hypothetical protein